MMYIKHVQGYDCDRSYFDRTYTYDSLVEVINSLIGEIKFGEVPFGVTRYDGKPLNQKVWDYAFKRSNKSKDYYLTFGEL